MQTNDQKACIWTGLFSLLTVLVLFGGFQSTAHAAAQKINPNAFGAANRLYLYHDAGTLTNVSIFNTANARVLSGNFDQVDHTITPAHDPDARWKKAAVWVNPSDLSGTASIMAEYSKIASYNGYELNCFVTMDGFNGKSRALNSETSYIKNSNSPNDRNRYFEFVKFSNNLYKGIHFQGFGATKIQLDFTYANDDGLGHKDQPVNFEGNTGSGVSAKGSFLTFASLNGKYHETFAQFTGKSSLIKVRTAIVTADHKEFVGYQHMGSYPYYVTSDTACGEYGPPVTSSPNLCSQVVGGRAEQNYSSNSYFVDAPGGANYNRSGVTFNIRTEQPQIFMIGSNINSMYFSYDSASIWASAPEKPTKSVYNKSKTEAAGNNIDKKYIQPGSDVYYHIKQKFGTLGGNQLVKYNSFQIKDTFDSGKMEMLKNSSKKWDAVLYRVDSGSFTAVDSGGTTSVSGNVLTYNASQSFVDDANNYGKEYILEIHMKAKSNVSGIAKNVAETNFNNTLTQKTNTVENYFPKIPTKQVTQDGKDVNGRNNSEAQKGAPDAALASGSEVQYSINQQWHKKAIDTNDDHYSEFGIKDTLESRLTYKENTAKVIDQSTGTDITSQGTIKYDNGTRTVNWEASSSFLAQNALNGRTLSLVFIAITPNTLKDYNIKNTGITTMNNISSKSNEVIIGVAVYQPVLIITRTGSNHVKMVQMVAVLILSIALSMCFYYWYRRKKSK